MKTVVRSNHYTQEKLNCCYRKTVLHFPTDSLLSIYNLVRITKICRVLELSTIFIFPLTVKILYQISLVDFFKQVLREYVCQETELENYRHEVENDIDVGEHPLETVASLA